MARPSFTAREAAVLDVFLKLGDAARRGLHTAERVAARQVAAAHAGARALADTLRARRGPRER